MGHILGQPPPSLTQRSHLKDTQVGVLINPKCRYHWFSTSLGQYIKWDPLKLGPVHCFHQ